MGKGTKRKNAGVGVDFRRVKAKVGKKLPRAANATDTSFRSRSIALPEQSVLQDKAGAAVTSRNLTLKARRGGPGRRAALQGARAAGGVAMAGAGRRRCSVELGPWLQPPLPV